jgi:hypothetical protein
MKIKKELDQRKKPSRSPLVAISVAVFSVFFFIGPFRLLDKMKYMPGDLGDSRFLLYILEATYKFICGEIDSIYNLTFFYPFPYTLGYSDHLFGSTLIYSLLRFLQFEPHLAYQFWYLLSFAANFFSCLFCLKKLQFNDSSSLIGSLIFTFALPVYERTGHCQLAYRFGVCFAITYFLLFIQKQKPTYLLTCLSMVVWQNACSLYVGFFTMVFVLILTITYIIPKGNGIKTFWHQIARIVANASVMTKVIYIFWLTVIILVQILIYFPYWKTASFYHISRQHSEIFQYLPQIQSYFTSKVSSLYNLNINESTNLTCPSEKRMFFGFSVFLALIVFFARGVHGKNTKMIQNLLLSSAALIVLTLSIRNQSLWCAFMDLPLFSGIRAVARLDLVLLMPICIFSSIGIQNLKSFFGSNSKFITIFLLFLCFMLAEFSCVKPNISEKKVWQERIAKKCTELKNYANADNFVIFANDNQAAFWVNEIDAMWAGLVLKIPVMNGYSGSSPGGLQPFCPANDFNAVAKRFVYFQNLRAKNRQGTTYENLIKKFVPIGFELNKTSFDEYLHFYLPSQATEKTHDYDCLIAKEVSIKVVGQKVDKYSDWRYIFIELSNNSNETLSALPKNTKPIRLSYRFLNKNETALSGWDTRVEIPFDIPSHKNSTLIIPIKKENAIGGEFIQISIVQEGLFWFHQFGFQPCQQRLSNVHEIKGDIYCFGEKIRP